MKELENELELRKAIKKRKPDFFRQDSHKMKRLGKKWRSPKGIHSKLKHRFRGHGEYVSQGYRSPVAVRGLDRSGLAVKNVANIKDLGHIDTKKEGIVIAGSVGKKKRLEILKKAVESGIKVLNFKDAKGCISRIEEDFKNRIDKKKSLKEKKKEKEKELKKKAKEKEEKKEGLAEKLENEEEKQLREKKEKDKFLIKKDAE